MYRALYNELVCRINFTCTKCILHTSSVLQHVSAHYNCHHQTVFVVVIIMRSNGRCIIQQTTVSIMITNTKTPWWWHAWCAETCQRTDDVWRIHSLNVTLVLQTNSLLGPMLHPSKCHFPI